MAVPLAPRVVLGPDAFAAERPVDAAALGWLAAVAQHLSRPTVAPTGRPAAAAATAAANAATGSPRVPSSTRRAGQAQSSGQAPRPASRRLATRTARGAG
jgi:hypothetical protein